MKLLELNDLFQMALELSFTKHCTFITPNGDITLGASFVVRDFKNNLTLIANISDKTVSLAKGIPIIARKNPKKEPQKIPIGIDFNIIDLYNGCLGLGYAEMSPSKIRDVIDYIEAVKDKEILKGLSDEDLMMLSRFSDIEIRFPAVEELKRRDNAHQITDYDRKKIM